MFWNFSIENHTSLLEQQDVSVENEVEDRLSDVENCSEENTTPQSTASKYSGDIDKIYDVATDRTIQSLMSEYKRRKQVLMVLMREV